MKKKKSFIYPIIFMSIITAIYTFVLAFLNFSTADRIELLQDTDLRKKILYVFDIPLESDDPNLIEDLFNERVQVEEGTNPAVFYTMDQGQVTAYALPISGPGLWGSIDGYLAVTADYSKVLGLEFTAHSETPGLGGRISEAEFLEQFRDLDLGQVDGSDYIVYRPAPGGNVDAITGATLTSKSVSILINEDLDQFIQERRG